MKNIIISGAAQGIGYYLVKQLLYDGYNVTVLDLNIDNLKQLCSEFKSLLPMVCDVRDAKAVAKCIQKSVDNFGSVDCAIHNACRCTFESIENTDEDTYRDVFNINYFGALHLTRAVIPYMKKQNRGKIIYTSSGVGITGFTNISPYASSKSAIETLAKCLNIEYKNSNITFHIFHPPLTRTKSSELLPVPNEFMADPETVGKGLAKNINKKRFIICHNSLLKFQTLCCYLFPLKTGRFFSRMTSNYTNKND